MVGRTVHHSNDKHDRKMATSRLLKIAGSGGSDALSWGNSTEATRIDAVKNTWPFRTMSTPLWLSPARNRPNTELLFEIL